MLEMSLQNPFLPLSASNLLIGSSRLNHQFRDKAKPATRGIDSFQGKLPVEEISEEFAIRNAT